MTDKILYIYTDKKPAFKSLEFDFVHNGMCFVSSSSFLFTDRFGIYRPDDRFLYDRLPKSTSRSFKEISVDRADYIAKSSSKPILVLSSCGIDSLAVIASFVLSGNIGKIKVVSFNAKELDVDIINYFKSIGVDYTIISDAKELPNVLDYTIVTGDVGDQINHSAYFFNELSIANAPTPRKALIHLQKIWEILKTQPEFIEWIKKSPLPLDTDEEKIWYISYACKWRDTQYQHLPCEIEKVFDKTMDINDFVAFFASDEFSDWGYTHYKEFTHIDFSSAKEYKKHFKEMILTTITDKTIADKIVNMGKGFSLGHQLLSKDETFSKRYGIYGNAPQYKYLIQSDDGKLRVVGHLD